MDDAIRDELRKATQAARTLLEQEFAAQLESTYDILPDGTIAKKTGPHLDAAGRLVRGKLVEAIQHRIAGGQKAGDAVADYTREAAFTCLNRFVALKMLEARELVQTCVSKGDQSGGFREFCGLAPGLSELPDGGYQLYLECLFDELSTEVKVLFDRRDPASLLWPRRQTLLSLLEILNQPELAGVWIEDETIGWVYQYFNSQEERRQMRDESQAPRNSRELAVRNQFFTPRYVVQFLTDNTLGRIWYEMRQGKTALVEKCQYLVRRPDEVFLGRTTSPDEECPSEGSVAMAKLLQSGEEAAFAPFDARDPDGIQRRIDLGYCVDGYERHAAGDEETWQWMQRTQRTVQDASDLSGFSTQELLDVLFLTCRNDHGTDGNGCEQDWYVRAANEVRRRALRSREPDLPQEELLKQPVFIPCRAKKDPRDLKILDPACGSGHFLLYCFDLLQTIYEEAWREERPMDGEPCSGKVTDHRPLATEYPTLDRLLAAIPGLILCHNVHGIDIDPRCAQIAAFALWMRAQRAYNDLQLEREQRPPIRKTNIVVAEPMPGEDDMLEEFLRELREDRLESLMQRALDIPTDRRVRATKAMADSLCDLVRTIWEKMKLAGVAGSLLKIEEELATAIAKGRGEWEEKLPLFRMTEYDLKGQSRDQYLKFVPGETEDFWGKAETLALAAMREFAGRASNGSGFRRRLFADDAQRGFAFVDLCRNLYDVVLMNPPFGDAPRTVFQYLQNQAPEAKRDLLTAFVQIFRERLLPSGALGAITKREPLFTTVYEPWRHLNFHSCGRVRLLADLGHGVLDDAMVEVAAYVVVSDPTDQPLVAFSKPISPCENDNCKVKFIDGLCYCVPQCELRAIPGGPIAYDVPPFVRRAYQHFSALAESVGRTAQGLGTTDDFRFARLRNEVPIYTVGRYGDGKDVSWIPYVKGEPAQMFFADVPVVTNWENDGAEVKEYNRERYGSASRNVKSETLYGRCGLVFPRRTKRFTPRLLPSGSIFSVGGQSIFCDDSDPGALLGLLSSHACNDVLQPLLGRADIDPQYEVGAIARIPIPDYSPMQKDLHRAVSGILKILKCEAMSDETTGYFQLLPLNSANGSPDEALAKFNLCRARRANEYANHLALVEKVAGDLYECTGDSLDRVDRSAILPKCFNPETKPGIAAKMVSICIGLAVNRFDSHILAACDLPECNDILSESVAVSAPALLPKQANSTSKLAPTAILIDDRGHPDDIETSIECAFGRIWPSGAHEAFRAIVSWLPNSSNDLRAWLRSEFFEYHIKTYTSNKRSAPIYWELSVPSHSYAVWLYYHSFTKDTFYKVLGKDYLGGKLEHEGHKLARVRAEVGESPTRTQTKELETQEGFVAELATFHEEVERIAPLWNPDLNDGVIINFAPLWRLVPQHRAWQKECKECWDALVAGDYDWAHLAMHLWPERAVPKCRNVRSLAIAHGLEDLFWVEDCDKWRAMGKPADEIEDQKKRRRLKQHDLLRGELTALADGVGAKRSTAELWKKLEAGELDDTGVALLLWPTRVVEKCAVEPKLADKLHVKIPGRRTNKAIEQLIKRYESNGCGHLAAAVGATLAERDIAYPIVWKSLETGALDDQALALALWPDRVVDKCLADVELAQKHDLARFFWYDDLWSKVWRRRELPDVEIANEVAPRHKPAVKAALESLLSAPTPGNGAKKRRKK